MMGYNFGMGGFFGMITMALFWVAIVVLAIWLVGKLFSNGGGALTTGSNVPHLPQSPVASLSASEILKQRYVRGEITKEQFEEMRRTIEAQPN